jgi:hypothetical protein
VAAEEEKRGSGKFGGDGEEEIGLPFLINILK